MGDMAFSTVGLDVETAVRCDIPIMTVVNNNSFMSIYSDSRFPVAIEKFQIKSLSGQFAEVGRAMGAYAEESDRAGGNCPRHQARPGGHERGRAGGAGVHHLRRGRVLQVLARSAGQDSGPL